MVEIVCPTCSTQYRVSESQLSTTSKLRCKKCDTVFRLQDNVKKETFSQSSDPLSDDQTMDIDLSKIELHYPETTPPVSDESTMTVPPDDLSLDMNLGELSLDFNTPSDSSSSEREPSLEIEEIPFPEDELSSEENTGEILDPLHDVSEPAGTDFSDFSLSFTGGSENETLSEAPTLDFSFSAAVPQDDGEEGDDEVGEEGEEEDAGYEPLSQEAYEANDLGIPLGDVNFGTDVEELMESPLEEESIVSGETVSYVSRREESEEVSYDESEDEELSACCIDSLAMGLTRCEICGRNLEGKDIRAAQQLQQQRRQELKESLIEAEIQVGFSEEPVDVDTSVTVPSKEDFSDVERALDALADGTFHQEVKKKQAKKSFAKTLKMVVAGALAVIIIIALASLTLLPSAHERLQSRYEQLIAQKEIDAGKLVQLFFDAAIKKDPEIFQRLTIMGTMPDITYGKVISVGEEYEKTSLGVPGQRLNILEQEIAALNKEMEEKTALLEEYSSKNLSPKIIAERIKLIEKRLEALHQEFEEKDAEISKKLRRLERQLEEIDEDFSKNRQLARKYIDATDQVGKALYENSLIKQKYLAEQKDKVLLQIQQEEAKYQKLRQELEAEYQPLFTKNEDQLQSERFLFEQANLLQDKQRSPVVVLSKELEQMTQTVINKKEDFEDTKTQLNQALAFFELNERGQIAVKKQDTEFVHVSKNVAASIKVGESLEQQVSIVLKHYQAILPDKTLQSDWLVEKIAK